MSEKRFVDEPPAGLEGWKRVWLEDLEFRPSPEPSFLSRLIVRLAAPIVRKVMLASGSRQRDFNIATLELLDDLRNDVAALKTDARRDVDDVRDELARVAERLPIGVRRNDALIAAIDQKIETVAARLRDVTTPVLLSSDKPAFRDDFIYRRLEDGLRGSPDRIRESLEPYVEYAAAMPPVIDVGCGRGEFLELCRKRGISARGFDLNERSVADLVSRGFDVNLHRLPECLQELDPGSVGSILASHVVEHLPSEILVETFAAAFKALRSGGFLMIETPNAQSVVMAASEFWRDPTHVAPRHVGAMTLIGRELGFEVAEVRPVAPFPEANQFSVESASPDVQIVIDRLNDLLFGDQNLRLVLRKP